ncbi:MAG: EamA family transporter [Marmoricola sp.]|jgi:DME family drug/metabolite transporter|nr:EamA family transporter [Marmoricola sp.]
MNALTASRGAADDTGVARLQVLAAAVCFGTTGTAQQLLRPDGTSTLAVGAARIILGGALLVGLARGGSLALVRAAWPLLLLGGLGVAIYQTSFFAAVDRTGVAVGTVVAIGSGPAIAGLLSRLVNGERLTARWTVATALAAVGVAVLALTAGEDASVEPVGIVLAVLAGGGYASYTVIAKRLLDRGHAPEQVMAATFGTGGLILVPVLLLSGTSWLADPEGLGLVLYLATVPTALAYALFARGLRNLGAGETATLVLAEPVTALVLGAVVLGERPGVGAVTGGLLVMGGLLVLALPGGRRRTTLLAPEVQP